MLGGTIEQVPKEQRLVSQIPIIKVHVEYQTSSQDKPVCDLARWLTDFIIYAQ